LDRAAAARLKLASIRLELKGNYMYDIHILEGLGLAIRCV